MGNRTTLALLSFAIFASCGGTPPQPAKTVSVVYEVEQLNLLRDYRIIEQRLASDSGKSGSQIRFHYFAYPAGDKAKLETATHEAIKSNPDLLIATNILSLKAAIPTWHPRRLLFESNVDPRRNLPVGNANETLYNATGIVFLRDLHAARLSLLRELDPSKRPIGLLGDRYFTSFAEGLADTKAAADKLGVQLAYYEVSDDLELDAALRGSVGKGIGSWYVSPGDRMRTNVDKIVALARENNQATVFWRLGDARKGGLLAIEESHAPFVDVMYRLVAMALAGADMNQIPITGPIGAKSALNVDTLNSLRLSLTPITRYKIDHFYSAPMRK
jgi:hypothetical protein